MGTRLWEADETHFTAIMPDASMVPRFAAGELLLLSRSAPIRLGDDLLIGLRGDPPDGQRGGTYLCRRLLGRSEQGLMLQRFNPGGCERLPWRQVRSLHRVLRLHELLGV